MNFAKQIDQLVSQSANNAAARQSTIDLASKHAAELFTFKCAETSGVLVDASIVSGLAGAYSNGITKTVDALLKVAPAESVCNQTSALAIGAGFADHQWEVHGHNVVAKSRERHNAISEFDRKNQPTMTEAIMAHGLTSAPSSVATPLMTAEHALAELENRYSKNYPAKKQKK